MTFEVFLEEMERANPKLFRAERISITVVSFKAQLRRAFDCGSKHSDSFHKDLKNMVGGNSDAGLFESLFGGKKS